MTQAAEVHDRLVTADELFRMPRDGVRRERGQEVGDAEGYWPGPPDLAVEVVSPGDTFAEVEEKVQAWLDV